MKPAPFTYVRPETLEEACAALGEHGSDAALLAGGQSLMPLLNLRLARPAVLVDIGRLAEIEGVANGGGDLRVGAGTRQRDFEIHPLLDIVPALRSAVSHMGSVATRNMGTVGGAVALADPVAELPTALVTLDGEVEVRSQRGTRRIPGRELYRSYYETVLEPDEILTGVTFPVPGPGTGTAFAEVTVRHWGDPTLVVAMASVTMEAGRCTAAHLGLGGVATTPLLAREAAGVLVGQQLSGEAITSAADAATADLDPPSDVHGTGAYRRRLARHLAGEVLAAAVSHATEEVTV